MADTSAHVGTFSEYVFRGVVANGGAVVQGGIDYHNDNGVLAGVWASNANVFGGSEFDLYLAYLHAFSETILVDAGALYYILPEDKEDPTINPAQQDFDTLEWFASLYAGDLKLQAYYSHDYVATSEEAFYYSASYLLELKPDLSLHFQFGYTHGDGAVASYGDEYIDYSVTLLKTIDDGLEFSLALIDTDLENEGAFLNSRDDPKLLIGIKRIFDF